MKRVGCCLLMVFIMMTHNTFAWNLVGDKRIHDVKKIPGSVVVPAKSLPGVSTPCEGSLTGKAVKSLGRWRSKWYMSKSEDYKTHRFYALYARLKIENAAPGKAAAVGQVWRKRQSRSAAGGELPSSKVTDAKWHYWLVGEYESLPGGEYFYLDFGPGATVWIDELILVPLNVSDAEMRFSELTGFENEKAKGWWQSGLDSSGRLSVQCDEDIPLSVYFRQGFEKKSTAELTVGYADGTSMSFPVKPGESHITAKAAGKTITSISTKVESNNPARLYVVVDLADATTLGANKLTVASDNHSLSQGLKNALNIGGFIIERDGLAKSKKDDDWILEVAPSTVKLRKYKILDTWGSDHAQKVSVQLAGNEYESFQLVYLPLRNAAPGKIKFSIKGDAPVEVSFERIEYVRCTAGAYYRPWKGLWPDPLIPLKQGEWSRVPLNSIQPFLVTLHAKKNTAPGNYELSVLIKDESGNVKKIPVEVKIHSFNIPERSSLRSAFYFYGMQKGGYGSLVDFYGVDPAPRSMRREWYRFTTKYRLTPVELSNDPSRWFVKFYLEKSGEVAFDFSKLVEHADYVINQCHGTAFSIASFWHAGILFEDFPVVSRETGKTMRIKTKRFSKKYLELTRKYVKEAEKALSPKGLWKYGYLELSDEYMKMSKKDVDKLTKILLKTSPDLKILAFDENPDYGICVRLTPKYRNSPPIPSGHSPEMWWYVCCSPKPKRDNGWVTNYFIDENGLDHRFHFWQAWEHGVQGVLYWGLNLWQYGTHGNSPAGTSKRWPSVPWIANPFPDINGDGYLMYPGKDGKPYASLRLAIMRDGLEDYEYFHILDKMIEKAEKLSPSNNEKMMKWLRNAKKIRNALKATIKNDYEKRDDKMLVENRGMVAELIEEGKMFSL